MKDRPKPLDDLEAAWMEDISADRTEASPKALGRLKGRMIVDQSLKKAHPLSIRVPDSDLEAIQLKAAKAGIPYQTLIKSILHRFATDQLEV
ncbi:MAG: hypothetical protein A2508_00275 [Candidatus Lambdaproteobacteria bacterium RIFOXYD12_FULL_49_8]|uniref:Antitoxin n=1 Tax=Candidatus Lambdaproteobacteria bacterium RIFOXYD2_FULL_50_16 TaxID=1817772 RepID=A0A1F6GDF4_9PROT|nr:MAG: hypothetical protein A2527_12420 [Candidatus Lambdaproteobacteria bacterium RIFOXYD2_FULL_50_16]OGG97301.1 MAG: hypothetical protein A2508_00275 [Candidatus Lambdaproteobacteria bacterium RIFOXYD12_FULL_49_8]